MIIQARGASLTYNDHGKTVYACRDANVEVHPNEFLGILGPSGSGKSSLLYLLSGLKSATSGSIVVDGQSIGRMSDEDRSRLRLKIFGFIFQQPFLLGYLTALENVALAFSGPTDRDAAAKLLEHLHLGDKLDRLPHELSGGERQRVCVARALIGHPKVIFADEPTASLDHANGVQVVKLLNQHRGEGSLVMVTHDPSMLEGADRILRIEDGCVVEE
ncbi:MAG: ABC transporter ATP-binding protein [Armatimonadetes bacterium]|nr:ABC transporter ATP-binding protein [Armatimonadota bacterium]